MACSAPGGPDVVTDRDWRTGPDGGSAASPFDGPSQLTQRAAGTCVPARAAQSLPARASVTSQEIARSHTTTLFTLDLFNLFKSYCGACHVETKLGNFQVTPQSFSNLVGAQALALMKSDDVTKVMPPPAGGGKPYSTRPPGDPVVQLVALLEAWMAQGSPDEVFTLATEQADKPSSYLLARQVGQGMTNLGDCVPDVPLVGSSPEEMNPKDVFFANATDLPDSLADTDLSTLDGEELARQAVIPYAPAYPLWSDDAGKLRHIRLPRGQAAVFDPQTQQFTFPANTRFYKTFMKKVIDGAGQVAYRKIETRLIVARPDRVGADGTVTTTALFGTYLWNDDETEARLLRDPLRNGKPFRDRLITYVTDEPKAQQVRDSMPPNLSFALEDENPGLLRHYAIPGSERCIQCHMGSPSQNFVLGFTPLQISRRADGEGGTYESTAPDEMTQLQRLIDYKVIAGVGSLSTILPLERSQGSRQPRNESELNAQGYLVGNCAHCHNPRGFPSLKNPELKDALDFLPSATGGIFQFPLDRTSPLRQRGPNLDVALPYLTPSLREYPVEASATDNWTPKWLDCSLDRSPFCGSSMSGPRHIDAPWRSLLYRNVDTPFIYADDFVIFPHMPMNTPGFDCRLPRLLGDWMVSIPATRKFPAIAEDAVPVAGAAVVVDKSPQPYQEVKPDDPAYAAAVSAATARLEAYHKGGRYEFCPDTRDIVDPVVLRRQKRADPMVPPAASVFDPLDPTLLIQPDLGVPIRPHWVVTDLTEPPGDWYPRRPDWDTALVQRQIDDSLLSTAERQTQKELVDALQTVTLTEELRKFVGTDLPFGLWQPKAECDLSGGPTVADFTGDKRMHWMDKTHAPAEAPVYMQSPGAAIFGTICINCHGPQADSKGLLSDAIMAMTGGDARVANLRDGLFGPADSPGSNRTRIYGPYAHSDLAGPVTADDWGARYMAWMALGGTQRVLPSAILNIVAASRVLGEQRATNRISPTGSPNMLKLAQELCTHVLPANLEVHPTLDRDFFQSGTFNWGEASGLIDTNADAEMWQRLCSLGNRRVVRVPLVGQWNEQTGVQTPLRLEAAESLFWADAYPADAPVLDHRGHLAKGVTADNLFPLCIRKPKDPKELAIAEGFLQTHPVGGAGGAVIPFCPAELFPADPTTWRLVSQLDVDTGRETYTDGQKWAVRGAINAGMAVFLYLDQIAKGQVVPKAPFNHCEQIRK